MVGITTAGRGWKAPKQCLQKEQVRSSNLNSPDITETEPESWPMAHTLNNMLHGVSSSVKLRSQPIKLLTGRVLKHHHRS